MNLHFEVEGGGTVWTATAFLVDAGGLMVTVTEATRGTPVEALAEARVCSLAILRGVVQAHESRR